MEAATLLDPLAVIDAAGEGNFEFAGGRLIPVSPQSHDHVGKSVFLAVLLRAFCEARGDGFAQRLDSGTVRVPDAAYFRPESLSRVHPTYSEGGADLVVEIVSLDSQVCDRGDKFVDPIRRTASFYRLAEGFYRPVSPDTEGRIDSSVAPGFWIRVEWLWTPPTLVGALRELGLV